MRACAIMSLISLGRVSECYISLAIDREDIEKLTYRFALGGVEFAGDSIEESLDLGGWINCPSPCEVERFYHFGVM